MDIDGGLLADERLRIPTPEPSTPDAVADAAVENVGKFGWAGPGGVTLALEIGRAAGRGKGEISGGPASFKKKKKHLTTI